jgi:hypothetical protein
MYWNKQAWPADSTKPVKVEVIESMKVKKKEQSRQGRSRGQSAPFRRLNTGLGVINTNMGGLELGLTIPIKPVRVQRVIPHLVPPQSYPDGCCSHDRSWVTSFVLRVRMIVMINFIRTCSVEG